MFAAPIALAHIAVTRRAPRFWVLICALLIFSAPFVFNYIYYGYFLPATGSAKIGQGRSGFWGEGRIFLNFGYLKAYFSGKEYPAALLVLAALLGGFLMRRSLYAMTLIACAGSLFSFYFILNIPNYHWYYAPFIYFIIIFAAKFFECAIDRALSLRSISMRLLSLGLVALSFGYVFVNSKPVEGGRHDGYAKIGEWLQRNTPKGASVALVEIGTVGWYSDRHIIDILGLTNKYNAEYISNSDVSSWLTRYSPDYILRHDPIWSLEAGVKRLEDLGCYVSVEGFKFDGYTMLMKADFCSE